MTTTDPEPLDPNTQPDLSINYRLQPIATSKPSSQYVLVYCGEDGRAHYFDLACPKESYLGLFNLLDEKGCYRACSQEEAALANEARSGNWRAARELLFLRVGQERFQVVRAPVCEVLRLN